jgi:hypothetical protein
MRPTPAVLSTVPGPRTRGVAIPPEIVRDIANITHSEALRGVHLNAPEPEGAALGRLPIPARPVDAAAVRESELSTGVKPVEAAPEAKPEQSAGLTKTGELNETAKRALAKRVGPVVAEHLAKNPNEALQSAFLKATSKQYADWANSAGYFKPGDPDN